MLTLTVFSVLTRCLGFLYKIYLSRIMTTTDLGIYNQTISVYMVLITIVSSSIPLTISKITSLNKSNNKAYLTSYSVTSSLIISTLLSITLCVLILILKPAILLIIGDSLGYEIIVILIPSIIFMALYSQIRGYLWGLENYFAVSIVEFVEQILRIAFCMIFVTLNIFHSPVIAVGMALSIACGISTIYGFILYFKNGGRLKYRQGFYKDIIKSSAPLTGVRLLGSLLQPIVAVLLPIQLTKFGMEKSMALSELGIIMGMSMPLLSIPSTIIGALCMVLIPRISSHEEDKNNINKQINSYLQFSIICLFMFIPIFLVLGIPICSFVFDNITAGIYLTYSAWIIIPMGISQITTSILNALNQEQKTFVYYLISSIFMIIIILITPKYLGIKAMIIGMGVSNTILAVLNLFKIKKLIGYNSQIILKLTYQILLSLPVIVITKLLYNLISKFMGNFVCLAICSITCVLSYISLLFVFNILDFKQVKNFLNKFFKKSPTKN
ncbi:MAG: oligosaccharide flippase family protein [Christensenellales bacterium]